MANGASRVNDESVYRFETNFRDLKRDVSAGRHVNGANDVSDADNVHDVSDVNVANVTFVAQYMFLDSYKGSGPIRIFTPEPSA